MFDNGMSLSDIAAVTKDNDSFGGGGALWLVIFVLFIAFGGFGGGFGNNANSNALTQAEMQAGFNNQAVIGKLDRLGDGISSLGYDQLGQMNAIQREMWQNTSGVINTVNQSAIATQNAICEANRNIDGVRYDGAMNAAAINANIDAKFAALEKSQLEQTIACQQNQINQLQLQSQLCGIVRYPQATTFSAGYNPYFGSNGCNSCC